ncbi:MAG: hypothetical protein K8U57_19990 [Planctomycetes bacterium]|nr:hypothetical protein [Planctomycetota bacterium]
MISDETTIPEQTTPVTEPAAPLPPPPEAEPEAAPPPIEAHAEAAPPTEETQTEPAPPTDHTPAAPAEMVAPVTPDEAPPEKEKAPKKPKKPKAAAVEVAGSDAAAILLGSTSEAPTPESEDVATEESETAEPNAEAATEPATEPVPENKKRWYAVKIQSGREESIKAAIERKVKIEGLEPFFGQIVIPVEELIVKKKVKVKNKKTGETTTQEKNVTKYNKKFPGYLFTEVEFNNDILYVFRETSGVGDFVGVNTKKTAGAVERSAPAPMTDDEVKSMLTGAPDPTKKRGGPKGKVVVKLDVEKGDKVRIRNGAFVGSEGEVKSITEPKDPTENPKVTVVVTFWGRPVDVEVDYWEVDKI